MDEKERRGRRERVARGMLFFSVFLGRSLCVSLSIPSPPPLSLHPLTPFFLLAIEGWTMTMRTATLWQRAATLTTTRTFSRLAVTCHLHHTLVP